MLEAFFLPFAEHFRRLGWRIDAVARGATNSEACRRVFDQVWDIGWIRQPLDPRNLGSPVRRIRHLVEEQRYNIVHVHSPVAAFVTRYALRGLRVRDGGPRVIYTAHGFHFYEDAHGLHNRAFLWAEQLAGHWTDYLVVINREDESAARKYHIVADDRVVYMPGIGVDTKRYAPERVSESEVASVRRELGLGPQDKLFLMIAEFNPGKRHCDAVRALAILRDHVAALRGGMATTQDDLGRRYYAGLQGTVGSPNSQSDQKDDRMDAARVHLAFAGVGPLVDRTKKLVRRLGVSPQVHFLGFRRDISVLIRASVATMLPSEREGLPRSVMESLCLGVPVIGTSIRGIRDLLDGGAGLLVPVGSPAELANAMAWVITHPVEARQMGEHGRRKMGEYDIHGIIRLHEKLYAEALRGREACRGT